MTWLSTGIVGGPSLFTSVSMTEIIKSISMAVYAGNKQPNISRSLGSWISLSICCLSSWKCVSKNLCGFWEVWCILLNNLLTFVCISYWVRLFRGKLLKTSTNSSNSPMIARPKTWRMRVSGLSPLICRQAWSRNVGSKLINNLIVMISGMPVNAPDRIYTPLLVYRLMIFLRNPMWPSILSNF